MRKEYDLKKLKKRRKKPQINIHATKVPINIRMDSSVLVDLKTEAHRLGIPYQTFIGSILYRFTQGELIDRQSIEVLKFTGN